jgi:hypothetical protein
MFIRLVPDLGTKYANSKRIGLQKTKRSGSLQTKGVSIHARQTAHVLIPATLLVSLSSLFNKTDPVIWVIWTGCFLRGSFTPIHVRGRE